MIFAREVDVRNKKPDGKSPVERVEKVIVGPATESSWKKFYKNDKKRVWLIVLATVTIIIANIFLPKEVTEKTTENPYFWAGVVALFGVHIIWGVFAPSKEMGRLEMAILYGIILFYGLTLVFPDDIVTIRDSGWGITKKVVANVATKFKSLNSNYGKAPEASAQQSAIVPAVYQPQMQTLHVIPGEGFKKVGIPPGRVIKDVTWNCQNGCILEIVHDGQPMCPTTNIYQGLPCGLLPVEVGSSGVPRYREQFVTPYGHFINFPRDIVVVGVAFGTDAVLGPIEVTATITL